MRDAFMSLNDAVDIEASSARRGGGGGLVVIISLCSIDSEPLMFACT